MTLTIPQAHTERMAVTPETSEKLRQNAAGAPRDASGHFVKKGSDPGSAVGSTLNTSNPVAVIKDGPDPLDEPLIVVQNPFKKLLHWLDQIRRKQTTTFDFKISIPLIALPIFLVVLGGAFLYFFNLGKQAQVPTGTQPSPLPVATSTPQMPVIVSKVGIIKATYMVLGDTDEQPSVTPLPPTDTPIPTITPSPTMPAVSRYVLEDDNHSIFFLITPASLSLQKYINKRVLVTGMYDKSKETITIKKTGDIEELP